MVVNRFTVMGNRAGGGGRGGSGAGVNIVPVGFLVVNESGTKMLPVDHCSAIDKLLDCNFFVVFS